MCFMSKYCVPGSVLGMAHTKAERRTTSLCGTEFILLSRGSWVTYVVKTCECVTHPENWNHSEVHF